MRVNVEMNGTDVVILLILAVIIFFLIRAFIGFWKKPAKPISQMDLDDKIKAGSKVELTVDGMMCGMCESHIKDAIREAVPDAKKVSASHTKGKADFVLPTTMTKRDLEDKLHGTIDPTGYKFMGMELKS